ncbi:MAG: DUF434 domain-containing protein [Planctomycetota bacterium]
MPDRRRHRSHAPGDPDHFSAESLPRLAEAVEHYAWLLDRGYADPSSLKLVGDRFRLVARQRDALRRIGCTADEREARAARRVAARDLVGATVAIDGFNVLTTVETALGGGVVLAARDGCVRDIASVHGTWRRVQETVPAVEAVADTLTGAEAATATSYLDAPVSNSGRLAAILRTVAEERALDWTVEIVPDPDRILPSCPAVVASADRAVLDASPRWTDLARLVIEEHVATPWIVDVTRRADLPSS